MLKTISACYDTKSQIFGNPFFSLNTNVAIRAFATAVNDNDSEISLYPSDFILYELGTFDDSTGLVTLHPERLYLGNGIQFRELPIIPPPEVKNDECPVQ